MIPKLYDSTETQFGSGCICRMAECTYCEVTEEPNKIYECEFRYPITGKYYHEIKEERFICCTHDNKKDVQPFRIYKRSAPMNGIVTFYAHHLSYKASNVILEPHSVTTPAEFVAGVNSHSINNNPFTFTTTKSGTGSLEFDTPVSCRSALLDSKKSIVSTFGGEFEFDKWAIKHHAERGTKTDVTIRYGKNLMDIDQSISNESLYNAIVPYWSGKIEGVDVLIMPEDDKIVTLDGVTNPVPIAKDFSSEFKNAPEESDLIQAARDFLESNQPWVPKENIKIDFIQLWQTDDYKDVASLQRVNLCDTLSVYYSELGVKAIDVKVVKTVYDTLNDRYSKMELGVLEGNFIQNAKENFDQQIYETAKGFESILAEEIEHATKLLTNPGDSHVVFVGIDEEGNRVYGSGVVPNPQEILVMNSTDPSTATEILRINKNGIGFASNINGPYRTAWTLDGHFVADFITAGTLNANLLRAGIISDFNTGTFIPTSDREVVAGKQYYIIHPVLNYDPYSLYDVGELVKYNGTTYKCISAITQTEEWTPAHWITSSSGDVYYTLVSNPRNSEINSYYEMQSNHNNYWNLETGEFRLSATTTIGGKTATTIADDAVNAQTQQFIFNKLTNNGTLPGIFMENGQLYINANYIKTGFIESDRIKVNDWLQAYDEYDQPVGKIGYGTYEHPSGDWDVDGIGMYNERGAIILDQDTSNIYLCAGTIEPIGRTSGRCVIDLRNVSQIIAPHATATYTGYQKVITDISEDSNGNLHWTWNYIYCNNGLVLGFS